MLVIGYEDRFKFHPDIVLHHMAALGKTWAFNVENGMHYTVNETAYWIFTHLGNGCTFQDLLKEFIDSYDVTYETAEKDLREFIMDMLDEGLIYQVREDGKEKR